MNKSVVFIGDNPLMYYLYDRRNQELDNRFVQVLLGSDTKDNVIEQISNVKYVRKLSTIDAHAIALMLAQGMSDVDIIAACERVGYNPETIMAQYNRNPYTLPRYLLRPCPRCKAKIGQECNREWQYALSRKQNHHKARA